MSTELELGSLSQSESDRTHTTRRRQFLALIAGAALLQACASTGTGRGGASTAASGESAAQERSVDPTTPSPESSGAVSSPRLPWALALGGGAARGLAHIGIIQVLEREGLVPDMVVGTSAGALVGALWASGMDAATLRSGVELTQKQLLTAFERSGMKVENPAAGDKFDPNQHQAIAMVDADQPGNTVVNVLQKGYQLSDRVLRPAMVTVAKG